LEEPAHADDDEDDDEDDDDYPDHCYYGACTREGTLSRGLSPLKEQ
jgi:hypothetical protein